MNESATPRETKVAHLRLPVQLHQDLTAFADRTHRSLNGAAVYLLERALLDEARTHS